MRMRWLVAGAVLGLLSGVLITRAVHRRGSGPELDAEPSGRHARVPSQRDRASRVDDRPQPADL